MVAVAAALQPERITIAGIDLYSHDQGRYPGDKEAIDGYSRNHSRTTDLEFIRSALSSYRGKLEILSEGLDARTEGTTGLTAASVANSCPTETDHIAGGRFVSRQTLPVHWKTGIPIEEVLHHSLPFQCWQLGHWRQYTAPFHIIQYFGNDGLC